MMGWNAQNRPKSEIWGLETHVFISVFLGLLNPQQTMTNNNDNSFLELISTRKEQRLESRQFGENQICLAPPQCLAHLFDGLWLIYVMRDRLRGQLHSSRKQRRKMKTQKSQQTSSNNSRQLKLDFLLWSATKWPDTPDTRKMFLPKTEYFRWKKFKPN